MFAVIKSGGKQYKVAAGDVIKLEKLPGNVGSMVQFSDVIAITSDSGQLTLGSPVVQGATVSGEILEQGKDEKVLIFKKRRRHNYRRKRGHRQEVTWLRVREIKFGSAIAAHKGENRKPYTRTDAHNARVATEQAAGKKGAPAKSKTAKTKSKKAAPAKASPKKSGGKPKTEGKAKKSTKE